MADKDGFDPQDFRKRFDHFFAVERERKDAVDQLLNELDRLQLEQRINLDDLIRERNSRRSLQEQLRDLAAKTERRGFVVVLIDADSDDYLFQEHFLRSGLKGGQDAADELCARVIEYLKSIKVNTENLDVLVRAFANFAGLQSACVKKGLLNSGQQISPFVHGFTQRRGLFDVIDVGPGREQADFKIKACLDLFVNNHLCKHVIVGVCHDGGYAPYLRNCASDLATRDKISLLQGDTMNASFKNLGFSHGPFKIEGIFAPSVKSWARISMAPSTPESTSLSHQHIEKAAKPFINEKAKAFADKLKPLRDADGKRVDRKLDVDPDSNYLKVVRAANFCGYYYLRGECDGRCGKNHVPKPLTSHEFDCLWYVLRQSGQCFKIRKGKDCEDPLCFYGHQISSP